MRIFSLLGFKEGSDSQPSSSSSILGGLGLFGFGALALLRLFGFHREPLNSGNFLFDRFLDHFHNNVFGV